MTRLRTGRPGGRSLVVALLCATLVGLTAAPAVAGGGAVVSMTNSSRSANGLPGYESSGDLSGVAQAWAEQMGASGQLAHNPGLSGQVSGWSALGENVGVGPSVDSVYEALMNSSGHRANILSGSYTQIGVGVAEAGGSVWVVQVFRKPSGSPAPPPAPEPPPAPAPPPAPEAPPAPAPGPTKKRSEARPSSEVPGPVPAPAAGPAPEAAPTAPRQPSPEEVAAYRAHVERLTQLRTLPDGGPATSWVVYWL